MVGDRGDEPGLGRAGLGAQAGGVGGRQRDAVGRRQGDEQQRRQARGHDGAGRRRVGGEVEVLRAVAQEALVEQRVGLPADDAALDVDRARRGAARARSRWPRRGSSPGRSRRRAGPDSSRATRASSAAPSPGPAGSATRGQGGISVAIIAATPADRDGNTGRPPGPCATGTSRSPKWSSRQRACVAGEPGRPRAVVLDGHRAQADAAASCAAPRGTRAPPRRRSPCRCRRRPPAGRSAARSRGGDRGACRCGDEQRHHDRETSAHGGDHRQAAPRRSRRAVGSDRGTTHAVSVRRAIRSGPLAPGCRHGSAARRGRRPGSPARRPAARGIACAAMRSACGPAGVGDAAGRIRCGSAPPSP